MESKEQTIDDARHSFQTSQKSRGPFAKYALKKMYLTVFGKAISQKIRSTSYLSSASSPLQR